MKSALDGLEGDGSLLIRSGSLEAINRKLQSLAEVDFSAGFAPFENQKGFAIQYDLRGLSEDERRRIVQLLISQAAQDSNRESPCSATVESSEKA